MSAPAAKRNERETRSKLHAGLALLAAGVLAACAPPQTAPRTVNEFMEDGLARDGVLTRCNADRDATLTDEECANARRAASAIALEAERAREADLARASEEKLLAMRERDASPAGSVQGQSSARAFGAPVGAVMPSMSDSPAFDVYADGTDALGRPTLEVEQAPPANDFKIDSPQIVLTDLEIVPRPLRDDSASQQ